MRTILNKMVALNAIKIISLFILAFSTSPKTQAEKIKTIAEPFLNIKINHIAPTAYASTFYQDFDGVLWIGTESGLVSYDGYNSQIFSYDPGLENTIPNNLVLTIREDDKNNLWIATDNGLSRFNKKTGIFSNYLTNRIEDKYSNSRIFDIIIDKKKRLWIATAEGVKQYNPDSDTFILHTPWHNNYAYKKVDIWPQVFFEDSHGYIWIGTSAGGLIRFNPDSHKFIHFSTHADNPNKVQSDFITQIEAYSPNQLLLGTEGGLFLFDTALFTSKKIGLKDHAGRIESLKKDKDDNWWFITGKYLFKSAFDFSDIYQYKPQEGLPISSKELFASNIFVDRENNIWTSINGAGIHYRPSSLTRLRKLEFRNQNYLDNIVQVNKISQSNEHLWISTNFGLSKLNLNSGEKTWLPLNDRKSQESDLGAVYDIFHSSQNLTWVGRDRGITSINAQNVYTNYEFLDNKINFNPINSVRSDSQGNIWITKSGIGILSFNPKTKILKRFNKLRELDIQDKNLTFLEISADQRRLYIALQNGVYVYDIDLDKLIEIENTRSPYRILNLQKVENNKLLVFYDSYYALEVDMNNLSTRKINFPLKNIECVLRSNNKYWLLQGKGKLSVWDGESSPPREFSEFEGAPEKGMVGGSCVKSKTGHLFFPSYSGVTVKHANTDINFSIKPQTNITRFIYGIDGLIPITVISPHSMNNHTDLDVTEINNNQFPLTFEFMSSSFTNSSSNRFKYRVKNLSDNWTETDPFTRSVSFSYIPPGQYLFEVYGSNADGKWSDEPAVVSFAILPPIWLTWWAKIAYFFLGLVGILMFNYKRTQSIRKKAENLENLVHKRTEELAQEKQIVEQLLDQKKEEFANVSHEFRTPLTLILGPIQNLLNSNLRSTTREKLEMAKRNSYRLLRMVDQLLHMEKFKVQQISDEEPQAIKPMFSLISQSFKDLALEKNIELVVERIEDIWIRFTPDALEKILLNLLSNALKYTEEGGKIYLSVFKDEYDQVIIIVRDTGIGISKEQQPKIFERYQRVLDEHSEKITGAGIGLALVKELVEAHSGTIQLDSEVGKGSIFTVKLANAMNSAPEEQDSGINTEILELELESIRNQTAQIINEQIKSAEMNDDGKTKLLVIEDNPDMRAYIIDTLSSHYHCLEAPNGKAGVEVAIETIPDLIISDVMMPEMDGYEVSKALKEDEKTSHIPLILLTARGDKESRMKGWKGHADEYLTKPFDEDELLIRVENLLSIRNILRHRFVKENFEGKSESQLKEIGLNDKDQQFIQKLNDTLDELHCNSTFEVSEMASRVAMSERQLQRKLKAVLDHSPNEYLRAYRLNRAKKLLLQGSRVGDVADDVGFTSQAYFAKCFKAQFGMTARQYQQQEN